MKKWDIFLGGPKEEFAPIPFYKKQIKAALPDKLMFDPFDPSFENLQKQGLWWPNDLLGLTHSSTMIAMVPAFPMPCLGPEVGIFYYYKCVNFNKPLAQLIIIWSDSIQPTYGCELMKKMGIVVQTIDEAVQALKDYFQNI